MLRVIIIPCLVGSMNNYAYLLVNGSECVVIDPSEYEPVLEKIKSEKKTLRAVLNTHHHWDHVGGNLQLKKQFPDIRVYGHEHDRERIPGLTQTLRDRQNFEEIGLSFCAFHVPGHTLGAVSYLVEGKIFTGDTLFSAGCGRLFEGNAKMMYHSLNHVLGGLPEDTEIYCGHEYTLNNLRFVLSIDSENQDVKNYQESVLKKIGEEGTSLPSTIGLEKKVNPFLRCDHFRGAGRNNDEEIFSELRHKKDRFV